MKVNIIQIGNSKGLRLSKTILEKYEITDSVNLRLEADHIVIEPIHNPRRNWAAQFEKVRKKGEDDLLIPDVFEDEELPEWK